MLLTNAREPYGCRKPGWPCNETYCWEEDECAGTHLPDVRCGHYVIQWLETFCVYTQGHWVQKPAEMLDWEINYLVELFSVNPASMLRQYRWTLLGIPKKNGKTELAGWLGDYMLVGDEEPSPWVAVAASSDNQANLVFGAAKRAAEWSPRLRDLIIPYESELQVPSVPGSKLVRLAAKAGTNDGPSWHGVICDELHEWGGPNGRNLWTVLTNGIGARREPLVVQITTAGYDIEGTLCGEQYRLGERLAIDPSIDPRYLFWWYQADPTADWRDPATWKDANPSWGATLPDPEAYLTDQITKKTENEFKRYFLNLWTLAEDCWLPDGAWPACEVPEVIFDKTQPLYVGIDGALKRDSFAIVMAQRTGNGKVRLAARLWENPYPIGHALRSSWRLNLEEPMNFLRELYDDFPEPAVITDTEYVPGPAFGYDPHYIEYAAQTLMQDGLNMISVSQTPARMNPASEKLYQLIMQGDAEQDGDPDFSRHIHGAIAQESERGWRVSKPRGSTRKIDAAIAAVIAVSLAWTPDNEEDPNIEGVALW